MRIKKVAWARPRRPHPWVLHSAGKGHRVLIVDLDPQGNATTRLGVDGRQFEKSVYDVLLNDTPMVDIVEPTGFNNFFVRPATLDWRESSKNSQRSSPEIRLKKAPRFGRGRFRLHLHRCLLLWASSRSMPLPRPPISCVPVQTEFYALEGSTQLKRIVDLVQKNLNPTLKISKVVLTMYDARNTLSVDVAKEVRLVTSRTSCARQSFLERCAWPRRHPSDNPSPYLTPHQGREGVPSTGRGDHPWLGDPVLERDVGPDPRRRRDVSSPSRSVAEIGPLRRVPVDLHTSKPLPAPQSPSTTTVSRHSRHR